MAPNRGTTTYHTPTTVGGMRRSTTALAELRQDALAAKARLGLPLVDAPWVGRVPQAYCRLCGSHQVTLVGNQRRGQLGPGYPGTEFDGMCEQCNKVQPCWLANAKPNPIPRKDENRGT